MTELQRTTSRIRTRFVAVSALLISGATFLSGLTVFFYMKSPAFETQLLGQVMKHMNWLVADDFKKLIEKRQKLQVDDEDNKN
tara:strand:- start:78 stop:326 length:249 start_codon:yes stop_codon:yes gene_type:complete